MKKSKQLFTIVSNEAFTIGHERKLDERELYLLIYTVTMTNQLGISWLSYDLIQHTTNLFNDKTSSRHIIKVKSIVQSLENKGYIEIVEEKSKYMKIMHLNKVDKNFTRIYHHEFERLTNPYDLYIYACVKKWENGAIYPYSIWCELLGVKEKRAIAIINDAVEREIIYKKMGDWNGMNSKSPNTYSTRPFIKKLSEMEGAEITKEKSLRLQNIIEEDQMHDVLSAVEHNHQWFSKQQVNYTIDDFVVYLTTQDKKILAAAEKAISRISKTNKGKWVMEDLRKKAEAKIKKEERKKENAREEKLRPQVYKMLDESKDIVLLVNEKLIKYIEYDGHSAVQKVFFYRIRYFSNSGDTEVLEAKNNPSNIEKYRPENGKWKHV